MPQLRYEAKGGVNKSQSEHFHGNEGAELDEIERVRDGHPPESGIVV